MSLEEHHCHMLEISFRLSSESFDKEGFLKDTEAPREADTYAWMYGSLAKPGQQHAELSFNFIQPERVGIRMLYHQAPFKVDDARPPYMEDCAKWLAGFIRTDSIVADLRAMFTFDKHYSSVLPLPAPPWTDNAALAGALIVGASIQFPKHTPLMRAFVQYRENAMTISARAKAELTLSTFDLDAELKKLIVPVLTLVKRTPNASETK